MNIQDGRCGANCGPGCMMGMDAEQEEERPSAADCPPSRAPGRSGGQPVLPALLGLDGQPALDAACTGCNSGSWGQGAHIRWAARRTCIRIRVKLF